MEDLLFADSSKVKLEIDEDNGLLLENDVEMKSGLEQMIEELEDDDQKKVEAEMRMADMMELKEVKNRKKLLMNQKSSRESEDRESSSSSKQDVEYLRKEKAELKTFGLSSRPRRSVNYASIERGEEATAQSLCTEFSTGKKRGKRTRDELDDNYDESAPVENKKKKQPISHLRHHTAKFIPKNTKYETELLKVMPKIDGERPAIEQRAIGIAIDNIPSIHKASGGFRRFLAFMNDELIMKLLAFVDENFIVEAENEEEKMSKVVRHAWNSLTKKDKKKWEKQAREDAIESFKLIGESTLPLTEVPSESAAERANRKKPDYLKKSDCCSMAPVFTNIQDVVSHYIEAHDSVHFYGCHFCYSIFTSTNAFSAHSCDQFATYMLSLSIAGEAMETKIAYFFLSCSDCGLWLPLRTKTAGQKCWPYFSASMLAHSCRTLVPVIVYFPEEVKEVNQVRLSFNVLPRVFCGVEQECKPCQIESFPSVAAVEEHFKTAHPDTIRKCVRCDESFGTDWAFRLHAVTHFNPSLLFANYLKYSATYHPPQSSSRNLHYGFDKSNFVVGGFDSSFDAMTCVEKYKYDEFVGPFENVVKSKLRYVIEEGATGRSRSGTPSSTTSSSSSSSEEVILKREDRPVRADLGYEHVDFIEMFEDSEIQAEAKKKCKQVIDTKLPRMFLIGEKLKNPEAVLEMLGSCEEKEVYNDEIVEDPLASDICAKFLRSISLPLASCIDPLKDFMLFNKIYYYCSDCQWIFSGDIDLHDKKCADNIIELFHPTTSASIGIRCTETGCDEKFCSVISLRCHVTLRHGKFINYETATGIEKRYDFSITALSKYHEILKNDKRSRMARFTDADIGMPVEGLLSRKENSKLFSIEPPEKSTRLIRPAVEGQTGYDCVFCCYSTQHLTHFQVHIGRFHLLPCERCGKSFASKESHKTHVCDRRFATVKYVHGHTICASCPFCQSRFAVTLLHAHILKLHYNQIRFVEGSKQVYPIGDDLKYEKPEAIKQVFPIRPMDVTTIGSQNGTSNTSMRATDRMKVIKYDQPTGNSDGVLVNGAQLVAQPANSVLYHPPSRNSADLRLTCYLCEMAFSSTAQLDEHLDKHPEKWTKCPFCQSPIRGHYDMQRHLLHTHMIRTVAAMVCEYCQIPSIRSPCAHLIYQCRRLPNCGICGIPVQSYDTHVSHMTTHHSNELKRIQCSFCAQIFITMTEFYDHICHSSANLQACACSSSKVFQTINDFCDHYDAAHVRPNLTCGICRNSSTTPAAFAKHRMSHMHAVSATLLRKVYLLPKWLHPPAARSSVASWGRMATTHRQVQPTPPIVVTIPPSPSASPRVLPVAPVPRGLRSVTQVVQRNGATLTDKLQAMFNNSTAKDDDDDDIVFEGTVQSSNKPISIPKSRGITPPKPAITVDPSVNAAVRIESNDVSEATAGQGQPGYVEEDDDEIEFVSEGQGAMQVEAISLKESAKVTVVEDPNADDDLAVVAEVENVSGVTSSTIASTSREKRFKCAKCSCSFITKVSLVKHMESHKSDAGASTSQDTFGLPVICNAYICRSCCLAFESRKKYQQHVVIHGETQLTCKLCSGIAFNHSIIAQHAKGHVTKSVYYACGSCKTRFHSDAHLMEHLHIQHGVALFYFCKLCGFGHTNLDKVFMHVRTSHQSDYTTAQRIGACPTTLLNFEPIEPNDFKRDLKEGKVKCFEPSDCSHRSLLVSNDGLVSCTSCHCTQSLHSFVAYNKKTDEPNALAFSYTEPRSVKHQEFAFMNFLSKVNMELMVMNGSSLPREPGQMRMPVTRQPVQNLRVVGAVPETRQGFGTRILRPVGSVVNPANLTNPPMNMARVVVTRPVNRLGNPALHNRVITNRTPGVGITQRPIIRTGEEISFGSDGVPIVGGNRDKCTTCNQLLTSPYDKAKHQMHTSIENKWFCIKCAHSEPSEMKMMVHYYKAHLAEVVSSNANVRPQIFDLKCPQMGCSVPPFQTLKMFERHLKTHKELLPCSSEMCEASFCTSAKQLEHDRIHKEYEAQNGCDANCCPICGTLDNWTMAKEPNIHIILSHISRHGLDFFSACRMCFEQFPDDNNYTQLMAHFKRHHLKECGGNQMTCGCGETELGVSQLRAHVFEKHTFNIVRKSSSSRFGELVIRAGAQLENYLGISRNITVREAIAQGVERID